MLRPLLLSSIITIGLSAIAQKKTMSVVDFLNIPALSNPQLSPDGKQLLYLLAESDWKENKQIGHIWRMGIDGGAPVRMTNGLKGESSPQWSPDGKLIAFIAERDPAEERQIFLINNNGGEAWQLTSHKTAVKDLEWAPDGTSIYFRANDPLTAEEEEKQKLKDDVFPYDEDYKQVHLWRVSVETGEEEQITEGGFSINAFSVSRDGQRVVAVRGISPLYDHSPDNEVWLMGIDGENPRKLTANKIPEFSAFLSPDNGRVFFLANSNADFEFYYNDKMFFVSPSGGDPQLITGETPHEAKAARWSADGKKIYLLYNMGAESQLFVYNLGKKSLKQITSGNHSIGRWHYNVQTDQHVFTVGTAKNPGDVYLMTGENFKTLRKITAVYDYLEKDFMLPRQEKISWKSQDGTTVEGMLYYPVNYVKGRTYPLVVQTHGGPASSDQFGISRGFTRYNPVLAGKGYLVLQPNYRGSTGYGDAFLRDMVGGYFRNAHLDVMSGVDHLISEGLADPDKLVKMGWSAGGHMTNKIITFTDRFKAASSGAGAINWISMYGQSDVRIYRTPWFGGTPWQENAPIDTYWDNSPLKDISKVKTPTLVIVGENDPRVPAPQSIELYRALKANGVPTHLYIAPREPHGWRELRHRLYKINAELEWFARYALQGDYEWEPAPMVD